jgi:hypothetical protein
LNPPKALDDHREQLPPPPEELVDPITLTLLVTLAQSNHQVLLVVQTSLFCFGLFCFVLSVKQTGVCSCGALWAQLQQGDDHQVAQYRSAL